MSPQTFLGTTVAALVGLIAPASAWELRTFGAAQISCSSWLADQKTEAAGNNWILGFWTGSNAEDELNHLVGNSTDDRGIVASVKKACNADPAQSLFQAARSVYIDFYVKGK